MAAFSDTGHQADLHPGRKIPIPNAMAKGNAGATMISITNVLPLTLVCGHLRRDVPGPTFSTFGIDAAL